MSQWRTGLGEGIGLNVVNVVMSNYLLAMNQFFWTEATWKCKIRKDPVGSKYLYTLGLLLQLGASHSESTNMSDFIFHLLYSI